jgi:hypothetical protein
VGGSGCVVCFDVNSGFLSDFAAVVGRAGWRNL